MDQHYLEKAMSAQYGMHDEVVVEGNFVELIGTNKRASAMVRVGLSKRLFIVANVVLNKAHNLDIDLQHSTQEPLVSLSIVCRDAIKRIKVKNDVAKQTRTYQMCSCDDQENLWHMFITHVAKLALGNKLTVWIDVPLSRLGIEPPPDEYNSTLISMLQPDDANGQDFVPFKDTAQTGSRSKSKYSLMHISGALYTMYAPRRPTESNSLPTLSVPAQSNNNGLLKPLEPGHFVNASQSVDALMSDSYVDNAHARFDAAVDDKKKGHKKQQKHAADDTSENGEDEAWPRSFIDDVTHGRRRGMWHIFLTLFRCIAVQPDDI